MEPVLLFRVHDAFHVRGNGWVLVPGPPRDGPQVGAGDRVELRGGEGPARTAVVKAVGVFAPSDDSMPLLVELDPTDRPQLVNADVWLVASGPR